MSCRREIMSMRAMNIVSNGNGTNGGLAFLQFFCLVLRRNGKTQYSKPKSFYLEEKKLASRAVFEMLGFRSVALF